MKHLVIVVMILAAATAALAWQPGDPGTSGYDAGTPDQQIGVSAPAIGQPAPAQAAPVAAILPPTPLTQEERAMQAEVCRAASAGRPYINNHVVIVRRSGISLASLNREAETRGQADEQLRQGIIDANVDARKHADDVAGEAMRKAAIDAQKRADAAVVSAVTTAKTYVYKLWLHTRSSIAWLWVALILLPIVYIGLYHNRSQIFTRVKSWRRRRTPPTIDPATQPPAPAT